MLKPQIRLFPENRIKNDQAILFQATVAGTALSINIRTEQDTDC